MAVSHLECKECKAEYPLEALYVCDRCFGPLQVAYDHSRLQQDVGELRAVFRVVRRTSGATPTSCPSPAALPVRPAVWPRGWDCRRVARR